LFPLAQNSVFPTKLAQKTIFFYKNFVVPLFEFLFLAKKETEKNRKEQKRAKKTKSNLHQ
jgi:hypothetical protein